MKPAVEPFARLEAALGNSPFPWQKRLLTRLLDGRLPRALDLPTGLGKTSVMAIWLVARACGATRLPRRLVYVVDRRAVVDQATREAEKLREWTRQPDVAAALGLDRALPISTLRGQFVDNREWLEDPSAPAIIVGTVDMVGSRLLFEGYACSRKMRPYHAGMLGCDTLFVLDEAHLVPPFERLLEQVGQSCLWPPDPVDSAMLAPLRLLSLSATGRDHGDRAFRLDADDLDCVVVEKRIRAAKAIRIDTVAPDETLAEGLAAHAWALAQGSVEPVRILVFSNKREDAEKAKDAVLRMARAARGRGQLPSAELLVGARRILERVAAEAKLKALGFIAGTGRPTDHAFLFATSAGEVGVDLDADHMVGDVVAWERTVQRLGRVNRRGERSAEVHLLMASDLDGSQLARAEATMSLLRALPEGHLLGSCDGSPAALGALARAPAHSDKVVAACTPAPYHPALTRPQLEAWAMTSLKTHTGRTEVGPWLRGWVDDRPQTTIAWRAQMPPTRMAATFFEAAPPHTSELLDAETDRVVPWLLARASRVAGRNDDHPQRVPKGDVVAFVLDGAGEVEASFSLEVLATPRDTKGKEILARQLSGRQLVVDRRLGGLSDAGLLDDKCDEITVAVDGADGDWLDPVDGSPVVRFRVEVRAEGAPLRSESGWRERLRLALTIDADEEVSQWLVVDKWRHDSATEDDRSSSRPQHLDEHQDWAAEEADRLASALGLPEPARQALVVAARLHDEGKRASRWQRAFSAPSDAAYAKTRGPVNVHLLDGYRHELGSLPLAQAHPDLQDLDEDQRTLVLHLIAAHHGFGRPVIGTRGCDDALPSQVEGRAREVLMRFTTLQERWGPWGLAWWETLLRAADQRASRKNDASKETR